MPAVRGVPLKHRDAASRWRESGKRWVGGAWCIHHQEIESASYQSDTVPKRYWRHVSWVLTAAVRFIAISSCAIFAPLLLAVSESANPILTGYIHAKWTHKDGLPGGNVGNIAQTPDGYIWLYTEAGLVRFDGVRFTAFASLPGVPKAIGWGLSVDAVGTLWVGLEQGGVITLRDGAATFHPPGNGLLPGAVRAILRAHDNAIWVLTSEGASRFQNDRWQSFRIRDVYPTRLAIAEDRDGTVAVVTLDGLYLKRAEDNIFVRDSSIGLVYMVGADADGSLEAWSNSQIGKAPGGIPQPNAPSEFSLLRDRNGVDWQYDLTGGLAVVRPNPFSKQNRSREILG